jgi:hypothetical protein
LKLFKNEKYSLEIDGLFLLIYLVVLGLEINMKEIDLQK